MQIEPKVLVVEDEKDIRELMVLHLERQSYRVLQSDSAEKAIELIHKNQDLKLLVLDWMLPGISGVEFLRRLPLNKRSFAVLMVTAKSAAEDVVMGLEAGADDYLTKPFDPQVLLARTRALLRRTKLEPSRILQLGSLVVYLDAHEVRDGQEVLSLTRSEFKLLVALVQNRGKVLSRDALVAQVQGEGISVTGRTIDTHMVGVRKKLGASGDLIETIRGVGYRVNTDDR